MPTPAGQGAGAIRYVALGDSYTIGTSVDPGDRWPDQLAARLAAWPGPAGRRLDLVANLAVDGYATADVIRDELPALDRLRPGLVSLLIGVNDVVQRVPLATYRSNVSHILDRLVSLVGAGGVVAVTTPDYTVTPAGADYGDPAVRAAAIRDANAAFAELALGREIAVVDIHDLSLRAAGDRSLVAADGLHPSAAQYALWVERISPVVADLIVR